MTNLLAAFWAEALKARRSSIPWLALLGFTLAPLMDGLFMFIMKDPERAREMGLLSTKAQLAMSTAEWTTFFSVLTQAIAVGGVMVFSIVTAWIFGREFSDHTAKELLALPVAREQIVTAADMMLPDEDLRADIDESYGHFVRHFGRPTGFSSPGFYSDERVMAHLDRLGFVYNGDGIGGEPTRAAADGRELRHWTIPVTLAGPRTIPFLEYHGARGTPDDQVIAELHRHLDGRDQVILYGHPCYEGVRESVLRKVFGAVLERGYRFVTMQTIARRLQSGALV